VTDPLGTVVALAVFTRDITDRKRAEESLKQLAYYDPLTRLPNRMLLEDRFAMALAQAKRAGQMLAVMSLDLDGFKAINDRLGHAAGDALLQHVADRLSSAIRESDSLGRWGGDEFTLIVSPVGDPEEAAGIAKRLVSALKAPLIMDGHRLRVTPSIGIALYPDDGDDLKTLLRAADSAMYRAKSAGRGRFEIAGSPAAA
jgi:diguanylate cyclase (GGDEF)-like protein